MMDPENSASARVRAAWLVQALQRSARVLAQHMYDRTPRIVEGGIAKRLRNRSAFISRHAARNYEHLLVEHVARSERERDLQADDVAASMARNARLRELVDRLSANVAELQQSDAKEKSPAPETPPSTPPSSCSTSPSTLFDQDEMDPFRSVFHDCLPDNMHDLFADHPPIL